MNIRVVSALFAVVSVSAAVVAAQKPAAQKPAAPPSMTVYKSPTCGCCSKWIDMVRAAGFTVKVNDVGQEALDRVKTEVGVPATAQSCHTGIVGNYVVEGHVPIAEVKRMLAEKPAVAGIAVGGMPTGSPGMEVPGVAPQRYNVVSFDKKGNTKVYATYPR